MKTCRGPECGRPAPFGELCDSHYHQVKKGQPLRPLRSYVRRNDLRAYVLESAERYAKAANATERVRAERDLMRAARKIGIHLAHGRDIVEEAA